MKKTWKFKREKDRLNESLFLRHTNLFFNSNIFEISGKIRFYIPWYQISYNYLFFSDILYNSIEEFPFLFFFFLKIISWMLKQRNVRIFIFWIYRLAHAFMAFTSPMSRCFDCFKWFPVLFIIAIITWSYYAYVIVLCVCKFKSFFVLWVNILLTFFFCCNFSTNKL